MFMQYLLSSSEDNTVRLWQVGRSRCLKVFSHSNYGLCFSRIPFYYINSAAVIRNFCLGSCVYFGFLVLIGLVVSSIDCSDMCPI